MAKEQFPSPLVPAQDFQFHVRHLAGDVLADFTGWQFKLVGRNGLDASQELFSYTESDAGVFTTGVFDLTDDKGNLLQYNLRVTIPHTDTDDLQHLDLQYARIGLLATPPSGSPIQLIRSFRANIADVEAP